MATDSTGQLYIPAKGVRVKSPSRVRIPLSPPVNLSVEQALSGRAPLLGGIVVANRCEMEGTLIRA